MVDMAEIAIADKGCKHSTRTQGTESSYVAGEAGEERELQTLDPNTGY